MKNIRKIFNVLKNGYEAIDNNYLKIGYAILMMLIAFSIYVLGAYAILILFLHGFDAIYQDVIILSGLNQFIDLNVTKFQVFLNNICLIIDLVASTSLKIYIKIIRNN